MFGRLTLLDPAGDEVALDGQQRELGGLAKVRDRGGRLSEFGDKGAAHGVIKMITLQHRALRNVVERVQPGLRAVNARDGNHTVHRGDRRAGEGEKLIVEMQDERPVVRDRRPVPKPGRPSRRCFRPW